LAVFSASRFGVRQSVAVRAGSTTISVATVRIVGIIDTNGKKTALISAAFAAAASKPDLLPLDFLLGVMGDPSDWFR
jgi:hypothetical protein